MSSSTPRSGGRMASWLILILILWTVYHHPWIILLMLLVGGVVIAGGIFLLHLDNQSTKWTELHHEGLKLHSRLLDLAIYPHTFSDQNLTSLESEIKRYSKKVKEHGGTFSPSPRDLAALLKQVKAIHNIQPTKNAQKKPTAKPKAKLKKQLTVFETQVEQCLSQAQSVTNFENTASAGKRRVLIALAENIAKDEKTRQAIVEACMAKLSIT